MPDTFLSLAGSPETTTLRIQTEWAGTGWGAVARGGDGARTRSTVDVHRRFPGSTSGSSLQARSQRPRKAKAALRPLAKQSQSRGAAAPFLSDEAEHRPMRR